MVEMMLTLKESIKNSKTKKKKVLSLNFNFEMVFLHDTYYINIIAVLKSIEA